MYITTKTFGHNLGISCAFRQWRATHSHCQFLHGYALQVELAFAADDLDDRNWGVDFGGLKEIKQFIIDNFDHRTVVAEDDPKLEWFIEADRLGIIDINVIPAVGCERFAEFIGEFVVKWLNENQYGDRVHLMAVEVREHEGNSATWLP